MEIELDDMIIIWDDEKAKLNVKKHGIHFEDAAWIFLDENRIEEYDFEHSNEEERIKTIGRVGKILVVIYTERENKTRIISARQASKKERNEYYGQYSYS